jgi:hypothetical protein
MHLQGWEEDDGSSSITVVISTDYLQKFAAQGGDVARELTGMLTHEMTHMYQQMDSDGKKVLGWLPPQPLRKQQRRPLVHAAHIPDADRTNAESTVERLPSDHGVPQHRKQSIEPLGSPTTS